MTEMISCDTCGIVLKNIFNRSSKTHDMSFTNDNKLVQYLTENKNYAHSYWADIEQTETSYMKYCPVCQAVKYFSEVKCGEE